MLAWYDPALQIPGDPARRARYRALQSWYRETVRRVEPGRHPHGQQLVGSMLPEDRALEGLNFLDQQIASYAELRAEEVIREGGTLDRDRLRRNLLSSMPLCFNLFGKLQAQRPAAARVLGTVLGLDIAAIDQILVEHAPPAANAVLGDRTAFDAFLAYTTSAGAKGFLGVETKYTEPFSPKAFHPDYYEQNRAYEWAGFRPGAGDRLGRPATNQLWRNTLLAAATRQTGGYAVGHAVVTAGRDDPIAWKAVAAVRAQLEDPDGMLRALSLERLIEQCHLEPSLAEWAAQFRQRYLDLSPITEHFRVPTTPEDQPVVPVGTIVSGRPNGWDRKGDPDGPELDDIPDVISGPLQGRLVNEPDHGPCHFKHTVNGLEVDPATIETTADPGIGLATASTIDEQVRRVAEHCRAVLGDLTVLPEPPGYPNGLALCVLDAIWSMGVRYTAVKRVISRYREHRRSLGADPDFDSLTDLLATIDQAGSPEGFADLVGNRQRTATRSGVLKADAVGTAARMLTGQAINHPPDLQVAIRTGRAEPVEEIWRAVPGQQSGISWRYLLMLAGVAEVKPDRMIRRFVADALHQVQVDAQTAARLVTEVQHTNPGVSLRALDHAIWQHQRTIRRPPNRSSPGEG